MRAFPVVIFSCLAFIAVSCKPSSLTERTPDEKQVEDVAPVMIRDAVWDESKNEITLALTEQEAYDASLVVIMIKLFNLIDGDFVPVEEQATTRWLTVAKGNMATPSSQLVISDLKTFDRLIVDLTYDSEQIESRTFDFSKKKKENKSEMATPRKSSD